MKGGCLEKLDVKKDAIHILIKERLLFQKVSKVTDLGHASLRIGSLSHAQGMSSLHHIPATFALSHMSFDQEFSRPLV